MRIINSRQTKVCFEFFQLISGRIIRLFWFPSNTFAFYSSCIRKWLFYRTRSRQCTLKSRQLSYFDDNCTLSTGILSSHSHNHLLIHLCILSAKCISSCVSGTVMGPRDSVNCYAPAFRDFMVW